MTDPGTADRTYIGPMTPELVEEIIANERPDAVLPTMGGEILSFFLVFFHLLGRFLFPLSPPRSFSSSSRPLLFSLTSHGILFPHSLTNENKKQAKRRSTSPRRSPSPASSTSEFSLIFSINFLDLPFLFFSSVLLLQCFRLFLYRSRSRVFFFSK